MIEMIDPLQEEILKLTTQPDKRVIASDFDVYLDRNRIVYVKEDCQPTDIRPPFFLHIKPSDDSDLPEYRRQYGFDNLDFSYPGFRISAEACAVIRRLPTYSIRYIYTGQFVTDAEGDISNLWEGEFSMNQPAGVIEQRVGN